MITGYLTAQEVADTAGLQYKTLWTYLKRGTLPAPDTYVGNKPLWKTESIDLWLSERKTLPANRVRRVE
jgi:predicted DNA-binding transcriptional regulator AlpA